MVIFKDNWLKTFKILRFELKISKNESRKFIIFCKEQQQQNKSIRKTEKQFGIVFYFMRYELFSKVGQSVSYYS